MPEPLTVEERERLEQLIETMETLADLSHKINNPLTALLGRAQMLQGRDGADDYVRNSCEVIEEASRRVADYVRELADVVREERARLERVES